MEESRTKLRSFPWLSSRTLLFRVFVETTIRSLKVKLLGGVQKSANFPGLEVGFRECRDAPQHVLRLSQLKRYDRNVQ